MKAMQRVWLSTIQASKKFETIRHLQQKLFFMKDYLLTLIRMTKDEKGLAFFKGLLL
jgi:hypothetical protein